jgi:hypothetical protein
MQENFRYIVGGKEVTRDEFFNIAGDWVTTVSGWDVSKQPFSNYFDGEKNKTAGLSTRHKAGKTMTYLDEAIEQSQKDDTITNVSRGEKEMMEWAQNKIVGDLEGVNRPPKTKGINTLDLSETVPLERIDFNPKWDSVWDIDDPSHPLFIRKKPSITQAIKMPKPTAINQSDFFDREQREKEIFDKFRKNMEEGVKETNGKVDYSEINLGILDLMAERFTANKHKYPKGNMKKPIDVKSLEWALFRHVKKMIQPIEEDEETYKDHLSAVLCNASMILDQLKNNPK